MNRLIRVLTGANWGRKQGSTLVAVALKSVLSRLQSCELADSLAQLTHRSLED
jgi:hypothetical protein